METFWLFLFGIFIGIILYHLVQLFPKRDRYLVCLLYTIDVYILFFFGKCLQFNSILFTSFIMGGIVSQLFLIISKYNYTDKPFIQVKNVQY